MKNPYLAFLYEDYVKSDVWKCAKNPTVGPLGIGAHHFIYDPQTHIGECKWCGEKREEKQVLFFR